MAAGEDEMVLTLSELQMARQQLRRRWELASVLNFLKVFQPLIESDLKVSAEEIETALIFPNDVLAQLHIMLLQGIPPVNRNLAETDAWVTITCKKLAVWWSWVAEGENPLKVDHGKEILRYKKLDPVTRLLILKALCEVRAEQHDVLRYVNDCLKNSSNISTFRKEKIGNANRATYWYDGDPVYGHRLYKETIKAGVGQHTEAKANSEIPMPVSEWETLATNLEEFQEVSETLSSSSCKGDACIGQTIKSDILPVLEELRKKKERALKRKQRQAMQLGDLMNAIHVGSRCSRRERRNVNYTCDEYDRAIEEAIHISKRSRANEMQDDNMRRNRRMLSGTKKCEQADDENRDDNEDAVQEDSEKENKPVHHNNVRRSSRLSKDINICLVEMKRRPRPAPTRDIGSDHLTLSESDDEDISEDNKDGIVSDSEEDLST